MTTAEISLRQHTDAASARPVVTGRRIAAVALAAGLIGVVAWALRPAPISAEVVAVTRGPLRVTVDEEGETRVRDRYIVSAPLAGRVLRIELEPGDPVFANRTPLAIFRPAAAGLLDARTRAEQRARIAAAEATLNGTRAELERTQAHLAQAQRDRERSRELAAAGVLSRERLEAAELATTALGNAVEAARASARSAEAELRMARASLLNPVSDGGGPTIVLRSPIDGVVLRRLRESESVVPQGEPILEVGDVANIEVVADFLSSDAVRITGGQPVLIERWGGSNTIRGRVRRVEPSGFTKISALGVEEQRVNVLIEFNDSREAFQQLGDRFRVEVRVVVWEATDVLKIPIGSLVRDGERWSVFVSRGEHAMRTPVTIGHRNEAEAEVVKGLAHGDRIITFPSDDVADGVAIQAP
jgi:HlyD family secretion protein